MAELQFVWQALQVGVVRAGFQKQDRPVAVFAQAGGQCATGRTPANDDNVVSHSFPLSDCGGSSQQVYGRGQGNHDRCGVSSRGGRGWRRSALSYQPVDSTADSEDVDLAVAVFPE